MDLSTLILLVHFLLPWQPGAGWSNCNAPSIVSIEAVSTNEIAVSWFKPAGDEPTLYQLQWTEDGSSESWQRDISSDQNSIVIDGLASGTMHSIRMRSICSVDTSSWKATVAGQTWISNDASCALTLPIDDNNCGRDTQVFVIDVETPPGRTTRLGSVDLIIEHSWLSDLHILLQNPQGERISLIANTGTGIQNLGIPSDSECVSSTTFADFACVSADSLVDNYVGDLLPSNPLAELGSDISTAGQWRLLICDDVEDDIGVLRYVRLNFDTSDCVIPPTIFPVQEDDTHIVFEIESYSPCDSITIVYRALNGLPNSTRVSCEQTQVIIDNLTVSSSYSLSARSHCQLSSTPWSCPIVQRTLCAPAQLFTNFESEQDGQPACDNALLFVDTIWQNSAQNVRQWSPFQGPTPTPGTGPTHGRGGRGKYVYIESSDAGCLSEPVILQSTCLMVGGQGTGCDVQFWYHMFGDSAGTLELDVTADNGSSWSTLWSNPVGNLNGWRLGIADLDGFARQYVQLRFTYMNYGIELADVALDNIVITDATPAPKSSQLYYVDSDLDEFGRDSLACACALTPPLGFSQNNSDCDDLNALVSPAMAEVACNLVDDNCNGVIDEVDPEVTLEYLLIAQLQPSCTGADDGTLEVEGQGGIGNYTFLWSSGDTTARVEGLAEGIYTCIISDGIGCQILTEEIVLAADNSMAYVPVNILDPTCPGIANGAIFGMVTGGTGPYTYQWSHGDSIRDPQNLVNGVYQMTVTDAMGCLVVSQEIALESTPDFIILPVDIQDASCSGSADGEIELVSQNAISPVWYLWNTGDTTQAIQNLVSGIYQCTVSDSTGCTGVIEDLLVGQPEVISVVVDAALPPECPNVLNGTIQITPHGGTPPYFFLWNTGSRNEDIFGLASGTYSVTVSDANNCMAIIDTFFLQEPTPVDVRIDTITHVECPADPTGLIQVEPSGGRPPYNYNWSTGYEGSNTLQGAPAGQYTVTVTDVFGCKSVLREGLEVQASSEPLASSINIEEPLLCFEDSTGSITVQLQNGLAPFNYHWSNGFIETTNALTSTIKQLVAGHYDVTITDSEGCVDVSATITLEAPTRLAIVDVQVKQNVCFGSADGQIALTVNGGLGPYTATWLHGDSGLVIDDLVPGAYVALVTDQNGCQIQTQEVPIIAADSVYFELSVTASTNGDSNGTATARLAGAKEPIVYQWDERTGNQTGPSATNLASGWYSVTATDTVGCAYMDSIFVDRTTSSVTPGTLVQLKAFPNPNKGNTRVSVPSVTSTVEVYALNGERVSNAWSWNSEMNAVDIQLHDASPGIFVIILDRKYIVRIVLIERS